MIKEYNKPTPIQIKSDTAAEKPIYIYHSKEKDKLLYSDSLIELLDFPEIKKPLKISSEGISFLLQSGVVPPPRTVYEEIYIVSIGDTAKITTTNDKIELRFSHKFPFQKSARNPDSGYDVGYESILQKLFDATIKNVDKSKDSFIFHSAGKDSNPIALAIAEAGAQDQFTLVTHKTAGTGDESEISKSIAKRLGFKHIILNEIENFEQTHTSAIKKHFTKAPLPCTDNVSLAYPIYVAQQPSLQECNIVDGMGSDVYIGHVPGKKENDRQKLSRVLSKLNFLTKHIDSNNIIIPLIRTRAECTGLSGFSSKDSGKIYNAHRDISSYWQSLSKNSRDYLDFRASVRGTVIDTEIFMRKVRNFADAFNNNLIFPWTDETVVNHFMFMPERYLIDRKRLRNKVLIREMLKQRIDLDSDKIGKMGFSYNSSSMIEKNKKTIEFEITSCTLWNNEAIKDFLSHASKTKEKNTRSSQINSSLIYRLYLISAWHNNCQWLQKS